MLGGDLTVRGRGREGGGPRRNCLRRRGGGRRGPGFLALRGFLNLSGRLDREVRIGRGLDLRWWLFHRLRYDLFFDFLLLLEALDRLAGRGVGHHLLGSGRNVRLRHGGARRYRRALPHHPTPRPPPFLPLAPLRPPPPPPPPPHTHNSPPDPPP